MIKIQEINKPFAKIPNDIFYNDGKIYNEIGGRDSFIIYSLLTSRKTMLNMVYISIKEISQSLKFDRNMGRAKKRIINSLIRLKDFGYISFNSDINKCRVDEIIVFNWVLQFKGDDSGWVKFLADDFELFYVVGSTPYIIMWLLRMFRNYKKGYSYISMNEISSIIGCGKTIIQNSINLFSTSGLFKVEGGSYYYHTEMETYIRRNNEYTYSYDINTVMNMTESEIFSILYEDRIKREVEMQENKAMKNT